MNALHNILVVAQPGAPWLGTFRAHARGHGWHLAIQAMTLDALTWLDQHQPRAIIIDSSVSRALTLCVMARAKPALADIPILGLVPAVDDLSFARWLVAGADDVVPVTAPSRIADRIGNVPLEGSLRPQASRGMAVVSHADPSRCDVVGRVLSQAGFDVRFALDAAKLCEYASEPDVQLVVASTAIGEPASLIERVRGTASLPAWVVADPALEPWAYPRPFGDRERAVIMSARSQPDAVLFASNALLSASGLRARRSTRVLFGAVVSFRRPEQVGAELGYSFNLSENGLFVRTLAPPPLGPVMLELTPPGSTVRHSFEGEVVWRRPFANPSLATAPPGFGARFVRGRGDAMSVWLEAYRSLASSSGVPISPAPESHPRSEPEELAGAITDATLPPTLRRPAPASPLPSQDNVVPLPIRSVDTLVEPEPPVQEPPAHEPPVVDPPADEPMAKVLSAQDPAPQPPMPPTPAPVYDGPVDFAPVELAPIAPSPLLPESHVIERTSRRSLALPALGAIGVLGLITASAIAIWAFVGDRFMSNAPAVAVASPESAETASAVFSAETSSPAVESAAAPVVSSAPVLPAAPEACPQLADGEGQNVLSYEGLLVVCAPEPLDVYASGVLVGKTNQKLVARCHMKYVRLGEGSPVRWRSEGKTVEIPCRGGVRVDIEPLPAKSN